MIRGYLYLSAMVLMTACAHVFFRFFSRRLSGKKSVKENIRQFLNPFLLSGVVFMASAPLLYFRALLYIELSKAYSITALNQIIVTASAIFLLKEKITLKKSAGIILVAAGVMLWNIQ